MRQKLLTVVVAILCIVSVANALTPQKDAAKGLWGFVDDRGKWVVKPKYQSADTLGYGLAMVNENGKYGIIDSGNGKVIIKPRSEEMGRMQGTPYVLYYGGVNGIFDMKERKPLFESPDEMGRVFLGGDTPLFKFKRNNRWGLFANGKIQIEPKYLSVSFTPSAIVLLEYLPETEPAEFANTIVSRTAPNDAEQLIYSMLTVIPFDGSKGFVRKISPHATRESFGPFVRYILRSDYDDADDFFLDKNFNVVAFGEHVDNLKPQTFGPYNMLPVGKDDAIIYKSDGTIVKIVTQRGDSITRVGDYWIFGNNSLDDQGNYRDAAGAGKNLAIRGDDGKFHFLSPEVDKSLTFDEAAYPSGDYMIVRIGDKWGTVHDGRLLGLNTFAETPSIDPETGYVILNQNGRKGLMDPTCSKVLVEPKFDNVKPISVYGNTALKTYLNGKQGLYSTDGRELLPANYDNILGNKNKSWVIQSKELWGLADSNGKVLVEPTYKEFIQTEDPDYFKVRKGGWWGVISKSGVAIIPPGDYKNIAVHPGECIQVDFKPYTFTGKPIAPPSNPRIQVIEDFGANGGGVAVKIKIFNMMGLPFKVLNTVTNPAGKVLAVYENEVPGSQIIKGRTWSDIYYISTTDLPTTYGFSQDVYVQTTFKTMDGKTIPATGGKKVKLTYKKR